MTNPVVLISAERAEIGRATALAFLRERARVVISSHGGKASRRSLP
jgi:NAD(P)-dependent dehydrogenase (short-subunit alcohol dehydrogenase family)